MKIFLQILVAMGIAGVLLGIAVSSVSTKPFVRTGQEEEAAAIIERVKEAEKLRSQNASVPMPAAGCSNPNHDFGIMDPLTVGEHTFLIQNEGRDSLVIQGGESSCKCTLSDLKEAIVLPGESYPVKLTWNSGHAKREFQQLAIVKTNDPANQEIRLKVEGEVRAILTARPDALDLQRLIPSTPVSREFSLYSQVWDNFKILRVESTHPNVTATESANYNPVVARDDEILNATSMTGIVVQYDGEAPQGRLSGLLRVYVQPPENWLVSSAADSLGKKDSESPASKEAVLTNLTMPTQEDGSVLVEIPYYGNVVRRLSLYGKPVQSEGSIDLGTLKPRASAGVKWTIIGRVRGDKLPEEVRAEITGIPGLEVEVATIGTDKAQNSFRLTIEVKESLRPAIYNRGQAGKLLINAVGMPPGDDVLEMPVNLVVVDS